jgi:hypothetical protein
MRDGDSDDAIAVAGVTLRFGAAPLTCGPSGKKLPSTDSSKEVQDG